MFKPSFDPPCVRGLRDLLWIGGAIGLLVLCLLPMPAHAVEMVSKGDNGSRLRLMLLPCTNATVLDQIKEDKRAEFQAAEATIRAGTFAGCWVATAEGGVFLVFEDGSNFAMPQGAFKVDEGV